MRRAALALALLLVAVAAACGRGGSALEETADKLGEVRSGELHLRVAASTLAQPEREVGFDVKGAFSLSEEKGALPKVRFSYTTLLGRQSQTTTFVSTGDQAFVVDGGRRTAVPEAAVAHLRGKAGKPALGGLEIDAWARSPKVDGNTITAEVDAAKALNDVFGMAASVGPGGGELPRIEGKDADRLQRAVKASRLEVTTTDDRVLRSLRLVLDLAPEAAELLGRYGGARLSVAIDLDRVNEPVDVQAP